MKSDLIVFIILVSRRFCVSVCVFGVSVCGEGGCGGVND